MPGTPRAGRAALLAALPAAFAGMLAGPPATTAARAEVTRFDVVGRERSALGGRTFGERGAAEKITGRATIAVDPADPHDAIIADVGLAPRGASGRVEAVADVVVLRPERPNGVLVLEIPNRGRKLIEPLMDDTTIPGGSRLETAEDAGRGFLLARGYTLVWVGWQGDVPPGAGMRIDLPVLEGVSGPAREEFVFDEARSDARSPATAPLTYPAADLDPAHARLTVRARPDDPRATPPGLSFRYLDPQRIEITRPAQGFDASALYELVYTARAPTVAGLGLAAIRDVATYLRHETGTGNPIARDGRTGIERAIGFGISQSGRVLRDFLYLGFNEDERGRTVFEGMMPHVAGSRRSFTNARFAQPGRSPGSHRDRYYPVDQFPFSYPTTTDALTGRRDGLLVRCRLSNTCPRIMHVDTEYEMWGSRGALTTTDTLGHQLDLPADVRAYMIAGSPHFSNADATTRTDPGCALPVNPVHAGAPARALLVALESWIADGVAPPSSRYPSLADGTLAPASRLYPAIPGLLYAGRYNPAQWVEQAGIEQGEGAPVVRGTYPLLLPRVDADGNALAGIRVPLIEAPRATYTGWNPTKGVAAESLCSLFGGVLPFARTRAEREAAGDPRPSLEERYGSPEATSPAYVAAVRASADRLVAERTLLPEDAARMVAAAAEGRLAR